MNNQTIKAAATLADYSKKAGEITDMYRRMTAFTEHAKKVRSFLDQQQKVLAVNENAKRMVAAAAVAGVAFICVAIASDYIGLPRILPGPKPYPSNKRKNTF